MLYHYLDHKRKESSAQLHATYLVSGKFVDNGQTVRSSLNSSGVQCFYLSHCLCGPDPVMISSRFPSEPQGVGGQRGSAGRWATVPLHPGCNQPHNQRRSLILLLYLLSQRDLTCRRGGTNWERLFIFRRHEIQDDPGGQCSRLQRPEGLAEGQWPSVQCRLRRGEGQSEGLQQVCKPLLSTHAIQYFLMPVRFNFLFKAPRVRTLSCSDCRYSAIRCASAVPMSSVELQHARDISRAPAPEPEQKKTLANGDAKPPAKLQKGIMGMFGNKAPPKAVDSSKDVKSEPKEEDVAAVSVYKRATTGLLTLPSVMLKVKVAFFPKQISCWSRDLN